MRAPLVLAAALGISLAVGASQATGHAEQLGPKPRPCQPAEVRSVVEGFITAFNAGDPRRLNRLFSPRPSFKWYSTDAPGERLLGSGATNRASLIPYLERRHASGERLTLETLRVNANTVTRTRSIGSYGNFELTLTRAATDLPPTDYVAKGALQCFRSAPDRLIAWSMGRAG